MAKLERKKFKVFAENAPLEEMGQFGSAVATTKKNTKDIEEIQELEAWQQGWGGAVISNKNYPPMEEMNGALNVMSYQTAYTLQEGIPEWNKDTVYYIGSIVKTLVDNKVVLYQSLKNNNIGNVLDNSEYWEKLSFGSGLEICDIGMALYVDETKGLRRYLNGQIVERNTNTQAFLNRLKQITILHPSLLCTEEEWQTAKTMSAFGQVGKFVFNYSGDEIVSVRLPRVVNVQGLFDLQNLGMTVEAGLPNIKDNGYLSINGSSSTLGDNLYPYDGHVWSSSNAKDVHFVFDASKASPIYGKSDTVQPEAIQYPYFIQIATGSETEANIVNEIELNNPYSLFDSKYSDHELNNLSWLKSEGQWNAKAVYPTAYDKLLKVYNGTETVEGLSVKLSTETYTDYDFVLNTADETFRLPLLNGDEHIADYTNSTTIGNNVDFIVPQNGFIRNFVTNASGTSYASVNGVAIIEHCSNASVYNDSDIVKVSKGDIYHSYFTSGSSVFYKAKGNGSLYFYVGETVQNANLIDAGRIGEALTLKTDKVQAANSSMPSNKYIDLTVGATGSTYTAPANGWFSLLRLVSTAAISIILTTNKKMYSRSVSTTTGTQTLKASIPVAKGDTLTVEWNGNSIGTYEFYFVYAEGEV